MSEEEVKALEKELHKLKSKNDEKDKIKELKQKIREEKSRASPWRKTMKDLGEIFGK